LNYVIDKLDYYLTQMPNLCRSQLVPGTTFLIRYQSKAVRLIVGRHCTTDLPMIMASEHVPCSCHAVAISYLESVDWLFSCLFAWWLFLFVP